MIIRIVKMTFRPVDVQKFETIFEQSKEKIRNFPGCTHLQLLQGANDDNVFSTYSHWKDEEDLNNYRNSAMFGKVWSETKKLFSKPPEAVSYKQIVKLD